MLLLGGSVRLFWWVGGRPKPCVFVGRGLPKTDSDFDPPLPTIPPIPPLPPLPTIPPTRALGLQSGLAPRQLRGRAASTKAPPGLRVLGGSLQLLPLLHRGDPGGPREPERAYVVFCSEGGGRWAFSSPLLTSFFCGGWVGLSKLFMERVGPFAKEKLSYFVVHANGLGGLPGIRVRVLCPASHGGTFDEHQPPARPRICVLHRTFAWS